MKPIALGGLVFALSVVSTQIEAQQTPSDVQSQSADQPAQNYVPPPPPPSPHERNRWVDVGGSRAASARHHAVKQHHDIAPEPKHAAHERREKHEAHETREAHGKHSKHARHESAMERPEAVPASKRTIRMCHKLTYTQIMKQSSCRDLMKQDLDSAEQRHSHVSQRGSKHHHASRRHSESQDTAPRHSASHTTKQHAAKKTTTKQHSTKHHHRD